MLKPSKSVGGPVSEQTPVDRGNLSRGPYVWAKAEAEREVVQSGPGLGLSVRVVRPGPLVDFGAYEPPGRLGRELGPVFLAVGPRWLERRPDLKVFWMPSWVLSILSPFAKAAQRIIFPKSIPIDLAAAFSSERYDATIAALIIRRAQSAPEARSA